MPWVASFRFDLAFYLAGFSAMQKGDLVLFYHSGTRREIVGVARVEREAYSDPTAEGGDWSVVDVAPVIPLAKPVTLATIKGDPLLAGTALVKQSRLSVMPLTTSEFELAEMIGVLQNAIRQTPV